MNTTSESARAFNYEAVKVTHQINDLLNRYIEVEDRVFGFSLRRSLPVPLTLSRIDETRLLAELHTISLELKEALQSLEEWRGQEVTDAVEHPLYEALVGYCGKLLLAISDLESICQGLCRKKSGGDGMFSYSLPRYRKDLKEYQVAVEAYYSCGDEGNDLLADYIRVVDLPSTSMAEDDRFDRALAFLRRVLPDFDEIAVTESSDVKSQYESLRLPLDMMVHVIVRPDADANDKLNIWGRILGVSDKSSLQSNLQIDVAQAVRDALALGFVSYASFTSHNGWENDVAEGSLARQWIALSLVADEVMKPYDQKLRGITKKLYKGYFDLFVRDMAKQELGMSFWARGRLDSFLTNVFFAGGLLVVCRGLIAEYPDLVPVLSKNVKPSMAKRIMARLSRLGEIP